MAASVLAQDTDPAYRMQHTSEIHGETMAQANTLTLVLLALRAVLSGLPPGHEQRTLIEAIDHRVLVEEHGLTDLDAPEPGRP